MTHPGRSFVAALVALAGLATAQLLSAQGTCGSAGETAQELPVHSAPPQFSTASGWELAPKVATLPPGASVSICEKTSVGFPGDTKSWVRIQFTSGGTRFEGWVYGEGTLRSNGRLVAAPVRQPFFGPAVAHAQAPGAPVGDGLPTQSGPWLFYAWAFLAICFGMAAKVAFDRLQQGGNFLMQDYMLRLLPPLLVSPMVFLTLSQFADVRFDSDGHGFIASLCTAFQSGFFWQTVLGSPKTPANSPAPEVQPVRGGVLMPS